MQNLYDLYQTNYISQSGRQFSIPDLTVLTGGEDEAAMVSAQLPQQPMEQNRNSKAMSAPTNVRNPVPADTQAASPSPVQVHTPPASAQTHTHTPTPAPMQNMQRNMTENQMPMHHTMMENTKPTPASSMADRIKSRQGCYIFAAIDLGCGHNTPIEGVLYEAGDDFFSVFDSARRTLTSYRIDDVKWFTTLLSCNDVIDFREDTVISR